MNFHRTTGTPKGSLSVAVGNSPEIRGGLVEQLLRTSPEAVALSVSVEDSLSGGYPVVQRLMTTTGPRSAAPASVGATGDPVVILRQDLVALHRATKDVHVVLALPEHDAQGEPLTPSEAAAALIRHLNPRAGVITLGRIAARQPASGRVLTRPQVPAQAREAWESRLDAVTYSCAYPGTNQAVSSVV
ncbi:hypothetical protein [Streptomyces sp. NPDC093707]|uniref:hypothetical protein n=1 Tax=Streptomyces sp. NPDC093707 TaxID=3154984 RepID=UPI00344E33AE